jgi:hypothetical protein
MTRFAIRRAARIAGALLIALALASLAAVPALAHEQRTVDGYELEVGFLNEPVYVGDKSGLDLRVSKDGQPVTGLESTVKAEVIYGSQSEPLTVSPTETDGAYEGVFIPTAAGPYTFHLTGTIEGNPIDEKFTSSPTGFNEVQDVSTGQFPNQLPAVADLAAQAQKGSDAAGQVPIALALGGVGLVVGLVALGIALAGRRRAA